MVHIRCLGKQTVSIGKKISQSKTKTIWQFEVDGIKSWVTLILSHFTRKYLILLNGIEHKSGTGFFSGVEHRFKYLDVNMYLKSNFKQRHLYLNNQEFDAISKISKMPTKKPNLFGSAMSNNRGYSNSGNQPGSRLIKMNDYGIIYILKWILSVSCLI